MNFLSSVDLPLQRSVEDYSIASDLVYQNISKRTAGVSVYRFGGCSAPGISDLDLIFVYPDNLCGKIRDISYGPLDNRYMSLFVHGPVVVSHSQFKKLPFFYPDMSIFHVGGPELEVDDILISDKQKLRLMVGIEILPLRWSNVTSIYFNKKLEVRRSLLIMASIRHNINHLSQCRAAKQSWLNFVEEVENVRQTHLSGKVDYLAISNLLLESEQIIREMLVSYNNLLTKEIGDCFEDNAPENVIVNNTSRRLTIHTRRISEKDFPTNDIVSIWKSYTEKGRLAFPQLSISHPGLLRHAKAVLWGEPPYGHKLAHRITPRLNIEKDIPQDRDYIRLARERSILGWQGVTGPLWSDIFNSLVYSPPFKECLKDFFRPVLRLKSKHRMNRSLSFIIKRLDHPEQL